MDFVEQNTIRTLFSRAMSDMYKQEVPQYQTLIEIVESVNAKTLSEDPSLLSLLKETNELNRISEERHGAIRLGKAEELHTMQRLFAIMGMYPVGYYDLSVAGIPVHSTAFRPIKDEDLKVNPFRVFTSLLRMDFIEDVKTRNLAEEILASRDIFTPRVRELIELYEIRGGFNLEEAKEFVNEALHTFRWHEKATVPYEKYKLLEEVHPLAADVVCFKGPHINHLTPRTLDIDIVQKMMPERGLNPKAVIEGPPRRKVPILLRQTSFKALEEAIVFPCEGGLDKPGTHRARFGEIEQRGAALTPRGKQLYETLTAKVRDAVIPKVDGSNAEEYYAALQDIFDAFPDNLNAMRDEGLVYLEYRLTQKGLENKGKIHSVDIDQLIKDGYVECNTIVYEDFLPVSAAGIFTSNLGEEDQQTIKAKPNQEALEAALGRKVLDPFELYSKKEKESLEDIFDQLGIE